MGNSLGISLGTRLLGMATMYDGELYEYRVKTFYGVWTERKRNRILRTIRRAIERHGVTVIVVKTPKPAHCTQSIHDLLADLRLLSEQAGIKLTVCTIATLTREYGSTKRQLMQALALRHSHHKQLAHLNIKERDNSGIYHVKMFEAIACAELAERTQQ